MYNYLPRNEDELELKEGDIVDVMEKCDDGWFVGKFWTHTGVGEETSSVYQLIHL